MSFPYFTNILTFQILCRDDDGHASSVRLACRTRGPAPLPTPPLPTPFSPLQHVQQLGVEAVEGLIGVAGGGLDVDHLGAEEGAQERGRHVAVAHERHRTRAAQV